MTPVFSVGREIVAGDDIVDRCLSIRAIREGVPESTTVGRHSSLETVLFMRRRGRERGFERFRGGGRHNTIYDSVLIKYNKL